MFAVNVTTQLSPQSLREPTSIQTSKDTYIIVRLPGAGLQPLMRFAHRECLLRPDYS